MYSPLRALSHSHTHLIFVLTLRTSSSHSLTLSLACPMYPPLALIHSFTHIFTLKLTLTRLLHPLSFSHSYILTPFTYLLNPFSSSLSLPCSSPEHATAHALISTCIPFLYLSLPHFLPFLLPYSHAYLCIPMDTASFLSPSTYPFLSRNHTPAYKHTHTNTILLRLLSFSLPPALLSS